MKPQFPTRKRPTRRYIVVVLAFVLTVALAWNLAREGDSTTGLEAQSLTKDRSKKKKKRFVTVVLVSDAPKLEDRPKRIRAIESTWGRSANAFYVVPASQNATDYAVDGIALVINNPTKANIRLGYDDLFSSNGPRLLVLPPDMDPMSVAPVTQFVIATLHRLILEPNLADFVLFANDHTFVLVDNVCQYLEIKDPQQPMHAGHALVGGGKYPFNSGAMGFVLSKATVAQLVKAFETGGTPPHGLCEKHVRHYLTECLVNQYNLSLADTRDAKGRHRFHGYGIIRTIEGKQDSWYTDFHKDPNNMLGFSNYEAEKGADCCSPETTTFHYVQEAETRALYSVRKTLQASNTKFSDAELQQLITEKWPTSWKEIGGYASGLPAATNTQLWEDLLYVIRLITPDKNSAYANGC